MKIQVGRFDFTEVWDGVLYKKLADYPRLNEWEKRCLAEFVCYERANGRLCPLMCEDRALKNEIEDALAAPEKLWQVPPPEKIQECTACRQGGCLTRWVCHTASPENAKSILIGGMLLSAVRARGKAAEELMLEKRNAAHDPADYFHYVMLSWGNCQAGDRLVMERKLGRFPEERDLSDEFMPGVRFYFLYDRLSKHPDAVFDGVLPMKIRDGIVLKDWVEWIVIPGYLAGEMMPCIPEELWPRLKIVDHQGLDIWAWSEKVYQTIEGGAI